MDPSGYCHRKYGVVKVGCFSFAFTCVLTSLRAIPGRSLCFSPDILLRSARFALPFPRTLKTAQVRFRFPSPDQGALPLLASTFCFTPNHLSWSQVSLSGLCFALAPLFPNPYSLIPLSQDQALDRLVSSSSIRYRTSTDDLSTLSSSRGLTHF